MLLTDRELIVARVAADGEREEHRLDAHWLRVERGERLVLASRGNRVVIGRFLSPDERDDLARQLDDAIAVMRTPRYGHAWDSAPTDLSGRARPARS